MNNNNEFAVEVNNLEKKFGAFTAVDKISFSIKKGEVFGFLGPNGAGKSTTIRILCGILVPTSGSGHVAGFDIVRQQERIKQNIGYMSQKFSLYEDLTVEENINFYSGIYTIPAEYKEERKEWIIKMAGLDKLRDSLTKNLSGGWKQRLALGCALIHQPGIIFLDEPTSGVDPIARKNFWSLIKEMARSGVTVFVTTHYMDEAENCDRAALIYRGAIIAMGSPMELKTRYMKENVLRVSVPEPEDWIHKLKTLKSVSEVALFGSALHIVTPDTVGAESQMKNLFLKEGIKDYAAVKIEPSLEDVFVSLIMGQGS